MDELRNPFFSLKLRLKNNLGLVGINFGSGSLTESHICIEPKNRIDIDTHILKELQFNLKENKYFFLLAYSRFPEENV